MTESHCTLGLSKGVFPLMFKLIKYQQTLNLIDEKVKKHNLLYCHQSISYEWDDGNKYDRQWCDLRVGTV